MSKHALALSALFLSIAVLAACQTPSTDLDDTHAIQNAADAYRAYERGDCDAVARSTDEDTIESWEAGEAQHSLRLIRGFCQELDGDTSAAIETYRHLIRIAPLSFASDDARERLRILRLFERDPDYQDWVDSARDRAAQGSTGRVPVDRIPAAFPPIARQAGIDGFAVVEFGVTPRGDTDAPVIVDSYPPLLFEGAALRAVREWRYARDPTSSKSKRQVIRIVFQAADDEPQIPAAESADDNDDDAVSTLQ